MKMLFKKFATSTFMQYKNVKHPESFSDLDSIPKVYDDFVSRLGSNYPGYKDDQYMSWLKNVRNSRSVISQTNEVYYYPELVKTWSTIYSKLVKLQYKYACKEHKENLFELEQAGILSKNEIPSFKKINHFLEKKTGFKLVNVGGMIDPRTFFYGLAFGIFYSTQYIRHSSVPFYSPEPDVVHEIMGHVPMLANPKFAKFSKELGKRALGADDFTINILAKVYFYTVEFGLVDSLVLGAGILGSCQELELVGKGKGKVEDWNLESFLSQDYTLSEYQPKYANIGSIENLERIFCEVDLFLQ